MATLSHGTILNYHNGSTYAAIGDVVNASWSGITREVVDISAMDDADYFRRYASGRADAGELSLTVNYTDGDTAQDAIIDQLISGTVTDSLDQYQLQFAGSGTTWSFTGFLTNFAWQFADGEKVALDVTVKISGKPTSA